MTASLGALAANPSTPPVVPVVSIATTTSGLPLRVLLTNLAKAAGYQPLVTKAPDTLVSINLHGVTPLEALSILVHLYGGGKLAYAVYPHDLLVIAPKGLLPPGGHSPGPGVSVAEPHRTAKPVASFKMPSSGGFVLYTAPVAKPAPPREISRTYQTRASPSKLIPALKALISAEFEAVPMDSQHLLVIKAPASVQTRVKDRLAVIDTVATGVPSYQIIRLSYYPAADMASLLRQMAGSSPGPTKTPGPRTGADIRNTVQASTYNNSLIVYGTSSFVRFVRTMVTALDRPTKEVVLSVRIQTVDTTASRSLNIGWTGNMGGLSFSLLPAKGVSFGVTPGKLMTPIQLGITLNALESKGESRTLSNTTLVAQNNQPVQLSSGGQLILPTAGTGTTSGSSTTGGSSTAGAAAPITGSYGLNINLTPAIHADGTITLTVNTQLGTPPTKGPAGSLLVPKQTLDTTITIANGQTAVLGGLISSSHNDGSSRIPVLSSLPILGALFQAHNVQDMHTMLLIIVSAKTVTPSQLPAHAQTSP